MDKPYSVIIIGGGPAGCSAAVYVARKKIKTLLITESFGGQSVVSDEIENWIGSIKISGPQLAKKLEEHVRAQEDIDIKVGEKVISVQKIKDGFKVKTARAEYKGMTLIVASGGRRRKLKVPGADKFEGRGISYCSTCDAPLFRDKIVAVIGGGNAGVEAVVDLLPYAKKIYLLSRGERLRGDIETQEEITKSKKVTIINNANTQEIVGDKFVTGLKYIDTKNRKQKEIKVQGVFVEIGSVPNSEFIKGLVKINKFGEIVANHKLGTTSNPAIFAAGDVTDEIYKQNNISAGDGIKAALSAYNYILKINKKSPCADCRE